MTRKVPILAINGEIACLFWYWVAVTIHYISLTFLFIESVPKKMVISPMAKTGGVPCYTVNFLGYIYSRTDSFPSSLMLYFLKAFIHLKLWRHVLRFPDKLFLVMTRKVPISAINERIACLLWYNCSCVYIYLYI